MKITKSQLEQIIKEELNTVLGEADREHSAYSQRGRDEAEALYDAFWEQAARETRDAVEKEDYEEYDLRSDNKEARSNVGYAISHLKGLLHKNPNPSPFEIIDAIDDGWDESYYEFSYAQEREMEEEDY